MGVVGMPDVACELPAECVVVEGWMGLECKVERGLGHRMMMAGSNAVEG